MKSVRGRFVVFPQRRLRFIAVPRILLAGHMAIKDWLVLEFVTPETPGKGVLRPDNLRPDFKPSFFQRVLKFPLPRGGVAYIDRGSFFHDAAVRAERGPKEALKLFR